MHNVIFFILYDYKKSKVHSFACYLNKQKICLVFKFYEKIKVVFKNLLNFLMYKNKKMLGI